ncbi:phosphoribosylanthranilate isomerase [Prevotella aurantiaca]|uniref:phosphoribosylanthranilate isomerase n=1 Tax=Prevotella aurantiaca TaxID=596085 RepID=UPI0028DD3CCA|nr:phosphoribosylanthranilate isomerase [Prevotella aurantiaca]
MIIKVCGTRDAENIHALAEFGVDWIGLDFRSDSPNYVRQISSRAGIIPDYGSREAAMGKASTHNDVAKGQVSKYVGIFADDMPQNIVTRVVNFNLDIVQLEGEESSIMINNLRSTIDPDIHAGIKIMKTLHIHTVEDLMQSREYEGTVDYFLFRIDTAKVDLDTIKAYAGETPFIIGGITLAQLDVVKGFQHAMFEGVDLGECTDVKSAVQALT